MPKTLGGPTAGRRGPALPFAVTLAAALLAGSAGDALAQSSTTPPPTAPSASPMGGARSAPADPGTALHPAGGASGTGASAGPKGGTTPLRNATTPPGITKPGQ